jgi:hypothetical protein
MFMMQNTRLLRDQAERNEITSLKGLFGYAIAPAKRLFISQAILNETEEMKIQEQGIWKEAVTGQRMKAAT